MKKILVLAVASCFFFGCTDPQVKEDLKILKEDLAKTKEDLAKLREDHENLIKDAAKAEVQKEDDMEGAKMD